MFRGRAAVGSGAQMAILAIARQAPQSTGNFAPLDTTVYKELFHRDISLERIVSMFFFFF